MKPETSKQIAQKKVPERAGRRVQVALPLKVTDWDQDYKPCPDMACTYDISPRGARITGLRGGKEIGDIIAIERGRNKSFCRVVWVGDPDSEFRGQVGIENVETERRMWEVELRDLQHTYDPVASEKLPRNSRMTHQNNRRHPRFTIEGAAEIRDKATQINTTKATLKDLSEVGCLLFADQAFPLGTVLQLDLVLGSYELALKAQVRHANSNGSMGLEFREIRKGDRQTLRFLLAKLAEQELEQSFELELQS